MICSGYDSAFGEKGSLRCTKFPACCALKFRAVQAYANKLSRKVVSISQFPKFLCKGIGVCVFSNLVDFEGYSVLTCLFAPGFEHSGIEIANNFTSRLPPWFSMACRLLLRVFQLLHLEIGWHGMPKVARALHFQKYLLTNKLSSIKPTNYNMCMIIASKQLFDAHCSI
jgi:hypothetical protein